MVLHFLNECVMKEDAKIESLEIVFLWERWHIKVSAGLLLAGHHSRHLPTGNLKIKRNVLKSTFSVSLPELSAL